MRWGMVVREVAILGMRGHPALASVVVVPAIVVVAFVLVGARRRRGRSPPATWCVCWVWMMSPLVN